MQGSTCPVKEGVHLGQDSYDYHNSQREGRPVALQNNTELLGGPFCPFHDNEKLSLAGVAQ